MISLVNLNSVLVRLMRASALSAALFASCTVGVQTNGGVSQAVEDDGEPVPQWGLRGLCDGSNHGANLAHNPSFESGIMGFPSEVLDDVAFVYVPPENSPNSDGSGATTEEEAGVESEPLAPDAVPPGTYTVTVDAQYLYSGWFGGDHTDQENYEGQFAVYNDGQNLDEGEHRAACYFIDVVNPQETYWVSFWARNLVGCAGIGCGKAAYADVFVYDMDASTNDVIEPAIADASFFNSEDPADPEGVYNYLGEPIDYYNQVNAVKVQLDPVEVAVWETAWQNVVWKWTPGANVQAGRKAVCVESVTHSIAEGYDMGVDDVEICTNSPAPPPAPAYNVYLPIVTNP